ncbi:excinuclease ABC subunit A, partial [Candidatus Woesearchaeota archaeon]|nr:excinuclease ABC subunit A [Candidatus Woesearchaeota archaeon]
MHDAIVIRGAREHNLKDISLTLPRNKFIVITGLSGSGKSTLAFDTIYAEGQRRYVESLSSYARQFLGLMNKPDVDSIEGLSPAISIEQKTTSRNPRSTVGTVTEIYDYLRLLFARVGTPFCPRHKVKIEKKSPEAITKAVQKDFSGQDLMILARIVSQKKGTYQKLIDDLNKAGFTRARVNGKIVRTDEKIALDRYKKHTIDVIIDRVNAEDTSRVTEAIERALQKGKGKCLLLTDKEERLYSSLFACPHCDISFEELQPRMFSFNSPFGACEECHGLGIRQEIDPDLVIPDTDKSIVDGAIAAYRNAVDGWRGQQIASVAKAYGFSPLTPVKDLDDDQLDVLLYGADKQIRFSYKSKRSVSAWEYAAEWEGIIPQMERLYQQTESDYRKREIEKFMRVLSCPSCKGHRLKDKVLAVRIAKKGISDITSMSIDRAASFFSTLRLTKQQTIIAKQVLKELNTRLSFLKDVGLGYLTLARSASSLSGGEAQRIRLATQIGSNLTGVLYVLDEPSIGLHQRDNHRLIETLTKLRDLGNTLIVVEHDEDTIRSADYLVDLGPGAGIHGGHITAKGTPKQVQGVASSITGQYLSGAQNIPVPKKRRSSSEMLTITGAEANNLKKIAVKIPLGV